MTIMLRLALVFLVCGAGAACTRPGPPVSDTTKPRITLTALNRAGNPSFDTREGPTAPIDSCAEFRAFPASLTLAVADSGGVRSAIVRVFGGRIVRSSVSVAPRNPESRWELTQEIRAGTHVADTLTITLATPAPGRVYTGLVMTLAVTPSNGTPLSVNGSAIDVRGNSQNLYTVDFRHSSDGVICRRDLAGRDPSPTPSLARAN